MKVVNKLMPFFHGVGLAVLWRVAVAYGGSVYAQNVLYQQYWWIPDLFILLTLAGGAAVSFYFGFRKEEDGFWRKLLICAGIFVTLGTVSMVGRFAVLGLPVIPVVPASDVIAVRSMIYGGAFFLLSALSQGIILLHFMTEKKFAG